MKIALFLLQCTNCDVIRLSSSNLLNCAMNSKSENYVTGKVSASFLFMQVHLIKTLKNNDIKKYRGISRKINLKTIKINGEPKISSSFKVAIDSYITAKVLRQYFKDETGKYLLKICIYGNEISAHQYHNIRPTIFLRLKRWFLTSTFHFLLLTGGLAINQVSLVSLATSSY